MAVQKFLGPLRPFVERIARSISSILRHFGIQSPPLSEQIVTALFLSFALIILTSFIVLYLNPLGKRDTRDTALIVGISGEGDAPAVGKTALFKALRYGQQPKYGTAPSIVVNEAVFTPKQAESVLNVRWVDFPGHVRLRPKLSEYLKRARCVLFVVDATQFAAQARRDADLLYDVLTHAVVANNATPVMIVINKCDGSGQPKVSSDTVRTRLEAELERVRMAKAGALRSVSVNDNDTEKDDEQVALGFDNEVFAFDHAAAPISFCSASAVTGKVDSIISFVRESFE